MTQILLNMDIAVSPFTTWALNQTQIFNAKEGFGYALASRIVGLSVTVALASDLVLHAVLAVSKAVYALSVGILEVVRGFIGYTDPIVFKSLSHWTKEEAAGHVRKVFICAVLSILNVPASLVAPGTVQIPMLVRSAVVQPPKALRKGIEVTVITKKGLFVCITLVTGIGLVCWGQCRFEGKDAKKQLNSKWRFIETEIHKLNELQKIKIEEALGFSQGSTHISDDEVTNLRNELAAVKQENKNLPSADQIPVSAIQELNLQLDGLEYF